MRFKRKYKVAPQLNLPTIADLAMLLLVFFLVCGKLGVRSPVLVESPRSITAEPAGGSDRPVIVSVTAEGQYFLDGQNVGVETLRGELEALLSRRQDRASRTVFVEVDKRTEFRDYVVAVDAVNNARGYLELKVVK